MDKDLNSVIAHDRLPLLAACTQAITEGEAGIERICSLTDSGDAPRLTGEQELLLLHFVTSERRVRGLGDHDEEVILDACDLRPQFYLLPGDDRLDDVTYSSIGDLLSSHPSPKVVRVIDTAESGDVIPGEVLTVFGQATRDGDHCMECTGEDGRAISLPSSLQVTLSTMIRPDPVSASVLAEMDMPQRVRTVTSSRRILHLVEVLEQKVVTASSSKHLLKLTSRTTHRFCTLTTESISPTVIIQLMAPLYSHILTGPLPIQRLGHHIASNSQVEDLDGPSRQGVVSESPTSEQTTAEERSTSRPDITLERPMSRLGRRPEAGIPPAGFSGGVSGPYVSTLSTDSELSPRDLSPRDFDRSSDDSVPEALPGDHYHGDHFHHPRTLTVEGVGDLLRQLNLGQYLPAFQEEQVDGELLVAMDHAMMTSEPFSMSRFHAMKLTLKMGSVNRSRRAVTTTSSQVN